jgi:hypothetical protein
MVSISIVFKIHAQRTIARIGVWITVGLHIIMVPGCPMREKRDRVSNADFVYLA